MREHWDKNPNSALEEKKFFWTSFFCCDFRKLDLVYGSSGFRIIRIEIATLNYAQQVLLYILVSKKSERADYNSCLR